MGILIVLSATVVFLAATAIERFFETRLGYVILGAAAACFAVALLVSGIARDSAGNLITSFAFALLAGAMLLRAFLPAK